MPQIMPVSRNGLGNSSGKAAGNAVGNGCRKCCRKWLGKCLGRTWEWALGNGLGMMVEDDILFTNHSRILTLFNIFLVVDSENCRGALHIVFCRYFPGLFLEDRRT